MEAAQGCDIYGDEVTAVMVAACDCRIACCQGLESAVLAFKLDKCWKEAGFRPLLDGQQVGLSRLLCSTEQSRLLSLHSVVPQEECLEKCQRGSIKASLSTQAVHFNASSAREFQYQLGLVFNSVHVCNATSCRNNDTG